MHYIHHPFLFSYNNKKRMSKIGIHVNFILCIVIEVTGT